MKLFENLVTVRLSRDLLVVADILDGRVDKHHARFEGFCYVDDVLGAIVHGCEGDLGAHLSDALGVGILEN